MTIEANAKTIPAERLEPGDRFTYLGAFIDYTVEESPRPDQQFTDRVTFKASRRGVERTTVYVTMRLGAKQDVTLQ